MHSAHVARILFALALVTSISACGSSASPSDDAGDLADAATADAAAADANAIDAAVDANTLDAASDADVPEDTGIDPNDLDGDGTANAIDNCPSITNATQIDTDTDAKGDACDACPLVANPGDAGCPVTIYAVKNGTVANGAAVAITNRLVTGRTAEGFYLQVKASDGDYAGANFSGVYVVDASNAVSVGDRVTLTTATVEYVLGQIRLTTPTVVVVASSGETPPAPVAVLPSEVATGGTRAAALESVIVQVSNVIATDVTPSPSVGDTGPTNEFVVETSLRVNDALYLVSPFPTTGQGYVSLTGILDRRNDDTKLEPRSVADVVLSAPVLVGFGPGLSFVNVGSSATPTFPMMLTVTLSHAPATDTYVTITSNDPTSLTVIGGGVTVLAGQTSAVVLVDGIQQSSSVTLTASLGAVPRTADVRVVGAAEQPSIVSLTPATPSLTPGGTILLTVTLDIPAPPGGTMIGLALTPSNAGSIPLILNVSAGQNTATFNYVDASMLASAVVKATLGGSMASSMITLIGGG